MKMINISPDIINNIVITIPVQKLDHSRTQPNKDHHSIDHSNMTFSD